MNEEAGFLAALLAEPDDRTTLLVYADWLDEYGDPRGAHLRLVAADDPEQHDLQWVHDNESYFWVQFVASRKFRIGDRVRIRAGELTGMKGRITAIAQDRTRAVLVPLVGRPIEVYMPFTALEQADQTQRKGPTD